MIITPWKNGVNQRFYSYKTQPKDNSITQEMLSGRVVGYQKNTKNLYLINCSLRLSVRDELPIFWSWFNDELGQLSGVFSCDALGVGKRFRFVSIPEPQDTDQLVRELSLEIEEV